MPNTYACKLVSNPNVPIFLPRVCTLVLFIVYFSTYICFPIFLSVIKDLKAPFPDLKAGHVDHLLTCVYFSKLCLLLLYCCLLFIFLPIFVFLFF